MASSNMAGMNWADKEVHNRKKEWRKWMWNRIKERCPVPPKKAIVLYLPGDDNADLKIAEQKGFQRKNMFGIERDPDIVAKLRSEKINVIQGDFVEVLQNWQAPPMIDVVMADFCCGLTESIYIFLHALINNDVLSVDGVMSINLMRGRDNFCKKLRSTFENKDKKIKTKHRGELFFYLYSVHLINRLIINKMYDCGSIRQGNTKDILYENLKNNFSFYLDLAKENKNISNAIFNTYKSPKGMWMDSACFRVAFQCKSKLRYPSRELTAKIAAAKAHRTMKTYL